MCVNKGRLHREGSESPVLRYLIRHGESEWNKAAVRAAQTRLSTLEVAGAGEPELTRDGAHHRPSSIRQRPRSGAPASPGSVVLLCASRHASSVGDVTCRCSQEPCYFGIYVQRAVMPKVSSHHSSRKILVRTFSAGPQVLTVLKGTASRHPALLPCLIRDHP